MIDIKIILSKIEDPNTKVKKKVIWIDLDSLGKIQLLVNKPDKPNIILDILETIYKRYKSKNIIEKQVKDIIGISHRKYITYTIHANLEISIDANKENYNFDYAVVFGILNILKTIFMGNVILKCSFSKDVLFQNCEFYGNFSKIGGYFDRSVIFNNAIFRKHVNFSENGFKQVAYFYGVTFEKLPNFNQTIFSDNLNLVNSNLNFDFDECNMAVLNTFKEQILISKNNIANDFRDSFRNFKSALIKDNNLLDASNYHKIELYFKEIELVSKKPTIFSKEWIDLWQLRFYRATSDNHTDLLKIVISLILLIGSFVAVIFINKSLDSLFDKKVIEVFFGVILILSLIYKYNKTALLDFLILLSCISCIWLLGSSPNIIFSVAELLNNNSKNSFVLNLIISIYTILFILLVFSLQKTARRNSIIPS